MRILSFGTYRECTGKFTLQINTDVNDSQNYTTKTMAIRFVLISKYKSKLNTQIHHVKYIRKSIRHNKYIVLNPAFIILSFIK